MSGTSSGEPLVVGPHATLRRLVNRAFVAAAIVLVVTGVVSIWSNLLSEEAARQRRDSFLRSDEITHLLSDLQAAETGQRGYLLTGDPVYLVPYQLAADSVPGDLARLRVMVTDSAQARRLVAIEPVIAAKLAELAETIDLQRSGNGTQALTVVASGQGQAERIRLDVAEMLAAEEAGRQRWEERLRTSLQVSMATSIAGVLFAIALLGLAAMVINRDFAGAADAESALRDSESRLMQILESLPIAVFVAEGSGRTYYANQASREILGAGIMPDAGIDDLPEVYQVYRAGTDEQCPADRLPIARALKGEAVHTTDLEIRRPDRVVPLEVWAAPVRDSKGGLALAVAAFTDLTERQQAEAALRQARLTADEANHAKSDFLAKMSHELRTPLNSIIGFSEVLEDESFGLLNEKQKRYVANVLTSGRSLLALINDILDLSRVEAGRMELVWQEFPVGDALVEVQSIVSALADKKNLKLELEVQDGLPPLLADQGKLKQIMYNLLSNAIKFTPEDGSVRVVARRSTRDEQGPPMIEIAVTDTGIGISPEDMQRIFGEFEQVASAYGGGQQGTGLGLALTQKMVELHGGRIWVESEAGVGSTFLFHLPFGQSHRSRPAVSSAEILVATTAASHESGRLDRVGSLVLIVEDNRQARDLLAHYLNEAGHRVAMAATGEEAIVLARQLKPDVITLDILLSGQDGHDVLAQLKASPETWDIPVVVVSITENRELGLSLGAADWFVKPARRDDFLGAIHRVLGEDGASGAAKVLVVDDEPSVLEFLDDLLGMQGFRVITARDGSQAIALALAHKPDVIVLDLVMPKISGFDVVSELSRRDETRDIPILVFSVMDLAPEERQRLQGRVKAIVMKGGGRDHLLRELARVTNGAGAEGGEP